MKERIACQLVAEYCARLGIPTANVETQRRMGRRRRNTGTWFKDENTIYIKTRGRSIPSIRHTVAHEVVHKAFPRKVHGQHYIPYNRYVKALLRGNMIFNGRGLA